MRSHAGSDGWHAGVGAVRTACAWEPRKHGSQLWVQGQWLIILTLHFPDFSVSMYYISQNNNKKSLSALKKKKKARLWCPDGQLCGPGAAGMKAWPRTQGVALGPSHLPGPGHSAREAGSP